MQINFRFFRKAATLCAMLLLAATALAQTPAPATKPFKDPESCFECHDDMLDEKVVHQAIKDGCLDCHSNIETGTRPHKYNGKLKYGLDAEQPKLCLGCHSKLVDKKKNVHKAIDKGCIGCHDPHSGKHPKLLKKAVPALCDKCHEKPEFEGKVTHKPVQEGKCMSCHESHASDNQSLLAKVPVEGCLECHKEIKEQPHVVSGFSRKGHPLGNDTPQVPDPLRKDKLFYCASCHEPHRSEFKRLLRVDPGQGMMVCQKCHEK